MFSKGRKNHTIDNLFPIILLLVFALSALVVMLFAANIYSGTVENSSRSNNARTSIAYVTEKIHQNDVLGGISEGKLDGCDALVLHSTIDNQEYCTYIYEADGELRELFVRADFKAGADAGSPILEVSSFRVERLSDRLLRITCADPSGNQASTIVGLRSE